MAWVPAALAEDGAAITISDDGRDATTADRRPRAVLRPRGRGAALVSLEFLVAAPQRRRRSRRAQPDGAPGARGRRALRGARRLERRGRATTAEPSARCDDASASPTSRTWASSSCSGAADAAARRSGCGDRDARRATLVVPADADARALVASRRRRGARARRPAPRRRRHRRVRRAGDRGPLARERSRASRALDLRPQVTPAGRLPARLGRAHARA